MDKKTYFIGGLLVILVVLIGVIYFFLKNDHNLDERDLKNSVSLASIKLDGNKIVEKFDVAIDGKDKSFEIEYDYIKNEYYGAIRGKVTGIKEKIQFKSDDEEIDKFIGDNFNESKIHDMIDVDDFRFIKGVDDKTYLLES
ncbi:MAG TPA: hypothetical protein DCY94_03150 [Firmicutes bacterium]|nr:hypothetical protein [Bacillota bacterium]